MVHYHSLPSQLAIQTPVAVPRVFAGELAQLLPQLAALFSLALVSMGRSPDAYEPAAPSFAHPVNLLEEPYDVASRCRLHHFRLTTSFSALISSACSATMCLSRRFSSSSSRNRRASLTFIPPYFAFHA